MWNIRVSVTQDQIDRGVQTDSHHCMIADAIHERLKWATYVTVDTQSIRFNNLKQKKRYIYLTPPEAQKAIILFDQGIKVKPFAFTMSRGFLQAVRTIRDRTRDLGKNRRTTMARRARRAVGRTTPKPIPSMYREFGVRALTR